MIALVSMRDVRDSRWKARRCYAEVYDGAVLVATLHARTVGTAYELLSGVVGSDGIHASCGGDTRQGLTPRMVA